LISGALKHVVLLSLFHFMFVDLEHVFSHTIASCFVQHYSEGKTYWSI